LCIYSAVLAQRKQLVIKEKAGLVSKLSKSMGRAKLRMRSFVVLRPGEYYWCSSKCSDYKIMDNICDDDYERQNQVTYIRITVFT
jgi:hypothetical protein